MRIVGGSAASFETKDSAASEIRKRAIARTGLDCYAEKDHGLTAKIEARMRDLGLANYADYLSLLDGARDSGEWGALIDEITVGETFFFRYPSQWDALRDTIIPDSLARNGHGPLRILCAGCANGAEPYTLAIVAEQELRPFLPGCSLSIAGVDISKTRIEQARSGVYGAWDLRAMPKHYRQCFERAGAGFRLRDEYRGDVAFSVVNFVGEGESFAAKHAGEFDIILCRNVMIYFSAETNRRVLQTFHGCLKDGGWFVTGHAEPYLEISNVFRPHPVDGVMFYRKQGVRDAPALPSRPVSAKTRPAMRRRPAQPAPVPAAAARPLDGGLEAARRSANMGHWREARTRCDVLAADDPFNPEIQFLIALVSDHVGETRAVEEALRRAIYLDGNFALAHYHLALALAGASDAAGARRALRNVFKCLGDAADSAPVRCGDGLAAGDLRGLAQMQLRVLGGDA